MCLCIASFIPVAISAILTPMFSFVLAILNIVLTVVYLLLMLITLKYIKKDIFAHSARIKKNDRTYWFLFSNISYYLVPYYLPHCTDRNRNYIYSLRLYNLHFLGYKLHYEYHRCNFIQTTKKEAINFLIFFYFPYFFFFLYFIKASHGGTSSPIDHKKKWAPVGPNHLKYFARIFCFTS